MKTRSCYGCWNHFSSLEKRQVVRKWNTNVSLVFGTASRTNTQTKTVDTSLATKEPPEKPSNEGFAHLIEAEVSSKILKAETPYENEKTKSFPPCHPPKSNNRSFSNPPGQGQPNNPPLPFQFTKASAGLVGAFLRRGPRHWVYKHVTVTVDGGNSVNSPVEVGSFFPTIYKVLYIPGGLFGMSEPSTVAW